MAGWLMELVDASMAGWWVRGQVTGWLLGWGDRRMGWTLPRVRAWGLPFLSQLGFWMPYAHEGGDLI